MSDTVSPLEGALKQFEATELNLKKLERVWGEAYDLISEGTKSCNNLSYENLRREFSSLLLALPAIDGWNPSAEPMEWNTIVLNRCEASEIGEPETLIRVEEDIAEPGSELRNYRYHFDKKRRELVRDAILELMAQVDTDIRKSKRLFRKSDPSHKSIKGKAWDSLKLHISQIDHLMGSSIQRPTRWSDLQRHLSFGMKQDLIDIYKHDWPEVKLGITRSLYSGNDPHPVQVKDLSELTSTKSGRPVASKLKWENLTPEEFERFVFVLISNADGYENPEWLMKINAPDRGRDLSVNRVIIDSLGGTERKRVIIQCRHLPNRSISAGDISTLKEQMTQWEPPRVDILVIATTGRFSSDGVSTIEKHNESDRALKIEMWPDSRLERFVAERPWLIAEFNLR